MKFNPLSADVEYTPYYTVVGFLQFCRLGCEFISVFLFSFPANQSRKETFRSETFKEAWTETIQVM